MNDDLLNSRRSIQRPSALRSKLTESRSHYTIENQNNSIAGANSTAFKILMLDRQTKANVTLNTLCIILFLNLVPFSVLLSTFFNKSWYLMAQTTNYNYWVNFISIQKICQPSSQTPLCSDGPVIYTELILQFYLQGCPSSNLTYQDPTNLCSVMASYAYSGLIATVTTFLGLILYLVNIYQLLKILWKRDQTRIGGFGPLTVACFAIFFFVGSMVYWFFASATLINDNSELALLQRFGSSAFCYFGSVVLFVLLVLWFQKINSKGRHKNLVTDLLKAEKKYVDQIHGESQMDVSMSTFQNL